MMSKMHLVALHCSLVKAHLGYGEKIGEYWCDGAAENLDKTDVAPIVVSGRRIMGGMADTIDPLWTATYESGPDIDSEILQEIFSAPSFETEDTGYRSLIKTKDGYMYSIVIFNMLDDVLTIYITGPNGNTVYSVR